MEAGCVYLDGGDGGFIWSDVEDGGFINLRGKLWRLVHVHHLNSDLRRGEEKNTEGNFCIYSAYFIVVKAKTSFSQTLG